jgi:2-polyprenyl-3-methyl-5-hydroxy-6-metoxy-1,4-benzoquinol methylase
LFAPALRLTDSGAHAGASELTVRDYYEELWAGLPADLQPPDYARRWEFLRRELRPGLRVLDLGCGDGRFTADIAAAGAQVTGADVAQAAIDRARRRVAQAEFTRVDIDGALPFDDGAFELVWGSEVIEHVSDTARWLSEVRRVLVPRGVLLLTTPSHGRLRLALGGIERFSEPLGDHLHLYTRRSLSETLVAFGFGELSIRAVAGPPLLRRVLLARGVR